METPKTDKPRAPRVARKPVSAPKRPSAPTNEGPLLRYRVEGIGRRGVIRYVKVSGRPGSWRISGLDGLRIEVKGQTVEDALKIARRRIPFKPVVVRLLTEDPAPPSA